MENDVVKSILNPVRIKIIQELGLHEKATTKELAESLADIPQATLYRHIARLVKSKVITVVEEHKVRGITEKVYALNTAPGSPMNPDVSTLTKKTLADMFTQYVIELLSDFDQCLSKSRTIDDTKTKLGFRSSSLYLSDEELTDVMLGIHELLNKHMANKARGDRHLRKVSTILTTSSCQEDKK